MDGGGDGRGLDVGLEHVYFKHELLLFLLLLVKSACLANFFFFAAVVVSRLSRTVQSEDLTREKVDHSR